MSSDKKDLDNLQRILKEGSEWLTQYGIMTRAFVLELLSDLFDQFPDIVDLDYYTEPETKRFEMTIYVNTLKLFFINKDKLVSDVLGFLENRLPEYKVLVTLKRFKKRG